MLLQPRKLSFFAFLCALMLAAPFGPSEPAQAAELASNPGAERLTWEDLTPPFDLSKDPFRRLTEDQQNLLYEFLWLREIAQEEEPEFGSDGEIREIRRKLESEGLNPDALVKEVEAFDRHVVVWGETLVEDLNGRDIQIAGYALPLEYSETAVTEFLLVPYIGACIHTPPPPANQMVHVRVAQGFEPKGLFTPIWVTGRVSTERQSLSLSYVDGTSAVSVGYGLEASIIEPYLY